MKTYPLIRAALLTKDAAVVLANGNYPTHPLPCAILQESDFVVCCDGAVNAYLNTGKYPVAVVGDGDSITPANAALLQAIIEPVTEQETNDLTKAIHYCTAHGKKIIYILGATGKREDHTIANISLLAEYMPFVEVVMVTDEGTFTPVESSAIFETYAGQQISLFSLEAKPLSVKDLRYPIQDRILTNWWQATLNEAIGDSFTLYTSGKMLVYRCF